VIPCDYTEHGSYDRLTYDFSALDPRVAKLLDRLSDTVSHFATELLLALLVADTAVPRTISEVRALLTFVPHAVDELPAGIRAHPLGCVLGMNPKCLEQWAVSARVVLAILETSRPVLPMGLNGPRVVNSGFAQRPPSLHVIAETT
jgi:hypothetical protein